MGSNMDIAVTPSLMVVYMKESGRMVRYMDKAASPSLLVV